MMHQSTNWNKTIDKGWWSMHYPYLKGRDGCLDHLTVFWVSWWLLRLGSLLLGCCLGCIRHVDCLCVLYENKQIASSLNSEQKQNASLCYTGNIYWESADLLESNLPQWAQLVSFATICAQFVFVGLILDVNLINF